MKGENEGRGEGSNAGRQLREGPGRRPGPPAHDARIRPPPPPRAPQGTGPTYSTSPGARWPRGIVDSPGAAPRPRRTRSRRWSSTTTAPTQTSGVGIVRRAVRRGVVIAGPVLAGLPGVDAVIIFGVWGD